MCLRGHLTLQFVVVLGCFLSVAAAEVPRDAQKFALLVGVNNYSDLTPLTCAAKDQWALAERLRRAGFPDDQIIVLASQMTDGRNNDDVKRLPIQRNILKWLSNVVDLTRKGDLLIVAFSGHGIQIGEHNYLCPIDADPEDPERTMIDVDLLNAKLKTSDAALKLLVLDACRDDPRPPGKRSAIGDVRFEYGLPPDGVVSIKSCSRGKTAREDPDLGHGVFMHFFLEGLDGKAAGDDGTVTLGRLFDYASRQTDKYVANKFGDVQRPVILPERVEQVALLRPSDRVALPAGNAGRAERPVEPSSTPGKPVQVQTNTTGMKLVTIPAGEFLMGSEDGSDDEKPRHRVRITKSFELGMYEVTQGEWERVMGTRPWSGKSSVKEGENYPATYVDWEVAVSFCRKLSQRESGRTYRLPTEAEWEYACRAGTDTRYSFGDDESRLGEYAWYDKNTYDIGEKYAHVVGLKKPNAWGLHDMHGNVWEWCSDWYDERYYANSPPADPQGPSGGSYRVYRGGGWINDAVLCRSAPRFRSAPSYRFSYLGFRVAAVPSQ